MRNWTTILFLLFTLTSFGQANFDKSKISEETQGIVNDIEKINMVMSGYGDDQPEQYYNFMKLKDNATKDEKKELTNHPNPTVRCYAFWALSHDHSVDLFSIVLSHISDSAYVETIFGCLGGGEPVGDFFISLVTPGEVDLEVKKLDSTQIAILDSILIFTPNSLWAKSTALNRVELTEGVYPKIRELVINNHSQNALVTLARYQKEQDVELI
jgi:hypothetical protein